MPFRFKGWSGNWLTNQSMPISNGTRYENGKNIINHLSITVGRNYNNVFNFLNFKWFAFLERSFPTTPINRARQFLNHELNHFLWLSNRFPSFFRLLLRTVRRGNLSDRLSYLTEMACLLSRRKWIMASGKFTGAGFFSLSEERSGVCGARSPHCEPAVTGRPPWAKPTESPWHQAHALGEEGNPSAYGLWAWQSQGMRLLWHTLKLAEPNRTQTWQECVSQAYTLNVHYESMWEVETQWSNG